MDRVNRWSCNWCGNTYLAQRELVLHEAVCKSRPTRAPIGPWPEPSPIVSMNARRREEEAKQARERRVAEAQAKADAAAASEDQKFRAGEAFEALNAAAKQAGLSVADMQQVLGTLNSATDNAFLHGATRPAPKPWYQGIRGLCQDCGRGFTTQGQMDAHRTNDHKPAPPPEPEKPKRKRAVRLTDED